MVAPFHLKSLQALELAVRLGSLRKAADALAITPAAVGQRVKVLEDYLGIDLLVRGRSGLKPTPELLRALPHLDAAFRELDACAAALDLQRGLEIHIAAASDLADLWLKPRLERFRAAHANIQFRVNGEGEAPTRLGRADCEISFSAPRRNGDTDVLFHDLLTPISSPDNTARISTIPKRKRLEGFPLLHIDFYKDDPAACDWQEWIAAHRLLRIPSARYPFPAYRPRRRGGALRRRSCYLRHGASIRVDRCGASLLALSGSAADLDDARLPGTLPQRHPGAPADATGPRLAR